MTAIADAEQKIRGLLSEIAAEGDCAGEGPRGNLEAEQEGGTPITPSGGENEAVAEIRHRLLEIYSRVNPEKQVEVDSMLASFEGREQKLLYKVEKKYFGSALSSEQMGPAVRGAAMPAATEPLPDGWDSGALEDGTTFFFRKDNPSEVSWSRPDPLPGSATHRLNGGGIGDASVPRDRPIPKIQTTRGRTGSGGSHRSLRGESEDEDSSQSRGGGSVKGLVGQIRQLGGLPGVETQELSGRVGLGRRAAAVSGNGSPDPDLSPIFQRLTGT